ncbi:endonuclease/exonuclease/phosphatase family protein [Mesorhizobium xinjiangense]|uniref:endonuclease/exonuclease/phosphatase family protein n=1 Tax=Mesorhizobium xinjiangense TaxID=2678685 RepID=UPI0012ED6757|nr:endonuclease/exonuclease/phosphatase family protein [Mesorhizobium xinjiangense]
MARGATKELAKSRLESAVLVVAVGSALALAGGYFNDLHPALDSLAHFRLHLGALTGACGVALLLLRNLAAAALALVIAAATLAGTYTPFSAKAGAGAGGPAAHYRLMQLNLRFDHHDPARVLSTIAHEKPDVVTLDEVSIMWRGKLDPLKASYPYRIICQTTNPIGAVAILSRRPFVEGRAPRCADRGSFAVAPIDFGGRTAEIVAVHLGWPWPYGQTEQVADLGRELETLGDTVLVAGDFNAAPWSATVRNVARAGGLEIARGIGPTWLHRALPDMLRRTIGLPIDQVMWKGRLDVLNAVTGPNAGSDHLPVIVDFTLRPGADGPIALARAG